MNMQNYRGMSDRLAAKRVDPNRDNMYSEVKMNEDAPNTTHVLVQEIKNNGSFEDVEQTEDNLKKITNQHNRLIDEILFQEDELIKQHESSIDQDVQNIKKEMESVEEVKREGKVLFINKQQRQALLTIWTIQVAFQAKNLGK